MTPQLGVTMASVLKTSVISQFPHSFPLQRKVLQNVPYWMMCHLFCEKKKGTYNTVMRLVTERTAVCWFNIIVVSGVNTQC